MKRATIILALLAGRLSAAALAGDGIRISFLNDAGARESTLDVLRQAGCPQSDVDVLRRAITHYYESPFNYDTSAFPAPTNGFHAFASAGGFVDALATNRLSQTEHMFEYNCLDTVLLIAGHGMIPPADFTAAGSPYLAVAIRTNGTEWLVPVASLQDVYNTAYPEWYQRFRTSISGREQPPACKTLAAALYQFHTLPLGTDEAGMREALFHALRSNWSRCGIRFPDNNMSVVMLHRARTDHHVAVSDHLGVLIEVPHGYIYLEKAGGQGPFLRIDTGRIEDIAIYYTTMMSPDYPLNYMTLNDDAIMDVRTNPVRRLGRPGGPRPGR